MTTSAPAVYHQSRDIDGKVCADKKVQDATRSAVRDTAMSGRGVWSSVNY